MSVNESEVWAIFTIVILVLKEWPRHRDMPFVFKLAHFFFVSFFLLISVAAIYPTILLFRDHDLFVEMFAHNLPQGTPRRDLIIVAIVFCFTGSILFFGALSLGSFKKWGRQSVSLFSLPYCALHPSVLVAMADLSGSPGASLVIYVLTVVFVFIAIAAMIMYSSKRFTKYVSYQW
jgi:hypothetical protein